MEYKKYIKALDATDFDHQLYPGDSIKIYGEETTITGFSAQYNDGLGKWETIIHTVKRGDPFERTLPDIEVLEEQPRSYEQRAAQLHHPKHSAVWVKASNEIPNHDGIVHLKIDGQNRIGNFYDDGQNKRIYIQGPEPYTLGEDKFEGIHWLRESLSEQRPVEQPNSLLPILQNITLADIDAPAFTHTQQFKEYFDYIKSKFIEVLSKGEPTPLTQSRADLIREANNRDMEGVKISDDAHEKEVMMQAFDRVRQIFESRDWIMEGRGSYPYNDDRYKEEVRYLFDEFEAIRKDTWANVKTKSFEYRKRIIEQYVKEQGNKERDVYVLSFHKWMSESGWHKHSSGQYYYRSKDHHQWPPDETCEERELVGKWNEWDNQQNRNNEPKH